jgi:hypothetical protein
MNRFDGRLAGAEIAGNSDATPGAGAHHAKRRKIGLFGMFGGGNFGNDASLESFLLFLREASFVSAIRSVCA